MKFEFHLRNAAGNNSHAAKLREQTRLALLCHGMRRAGHEAVIADIGTELAASKRWAFFSGMVGSLAGAVQVIPATFAKPVSSGSPRTVLVKDSASWSKDKHLLDCCHLAVFKEYDTAFADHPKLLPVPFLIHTDVMEHLIEDGVFGAYMNDDVAALRAMYGSEKDIIAGFVGTGHYGRRAKAAQLPAWCQFMFAERPQLSPGEYLRWITRCQVGFNMEGETPKSYRFSELTMMGVVNAAPECDTKVTPRLDATNSILMRDWSDADAITEGLKRADEIVAEADRCYRIGWSPTGQSRLIAERLEYV